MLQIPSDKHQSLPNDLQWVLLAEYSLSELTCDQETGEALTAGWLDQTIRDSDIPFECLHRVERTLIESTQQMKEHVIQGESIFPMTIRLFVEKKRTKHENSAKTEGKLQGIQTLAPSKNLQPAGARITGGWGFFIIQKARGLPTGSTFNTSNCIDFYLYQEGE